MGLVKIVPLYAIKA